MAEINIERKEGGSILPWILGLLLLALLIWGVYEMFDDDAAGDVAVATAPEVMPATDPGMTDPGMAATAPAADVSVGEAIPVAAIMSAPGNYANQAVSGTARVAEVVSDRGFWIEDAGQRTFAVIDEPKPEIKNIRAGQMVRLNGAQVMTNASQVPGQLDAQTQQIIGNQAAFIYVQAPNIFITETAS